MVKIYSLNDPDTLEIKYIGKTVQKLEKRLSGHITKAKYNRTTHCSCWIYKLLLKGKRPKIQLIEECLENIWIEIYIKSNKSYDIGDCLEVMKASSADFVDASEI